MRHRFTKHRFPPFLTDGVLLIDKPPEWTSFDVVNFLRSRFNIPKVGHCGTLDPAATGLLVVVLNQFTRLSQKLSGHDKTYQATLLLGTETDSQDMDGNITAEHDYSAVTAGELRRTIAGFIGDQLQTPPMVSAVKKDGKRLYELARQGLEISREPKPIRIASIEISRIELPYCDFTVQCSTGTYIRTLCADIGRRLGCGAALFRLRRLRSGPFRLEDAIPLETLKTWEQPELERCIRNFLATQMAAYSGEFDN